MRISLLVLVVAAWPVAAQVVGPTSGYVFAPETRELRPIRGMVGTAYLGDALVKDADSVAVSSDGTLAAVARNGAVELIRGFDSGTPVRLALAEEAGSVLLAWSGDDLAAVFVASRRAMVWRKGSAADSVSLAGVDGAIRGVLLDGDNLVIAADGGLFLSRKGETRRLVALTEPSAVIRSGKDLLVADRGASQVTMVRDYAGEAPSPATFASVGQPVGLQLTARHLLVASAATRSVEAFDLLSHDRVSSLELDFVPTRLEGLGGRPLALLNQGAADEPLYVLDAKDALRVYFVPAGRNQ